MPEVREWLYFTRGDFKRCSLYFFTIYLELILVVDQLNRTAVDLYSFIFIQPSLKVEQIDVMPMLRLSTFCMEFQYKRYLIFTIYILTICYPVQPTNTRQVWIGRLARLSFRLLEMALPWCYSITGLKGFQTASENCPRYIYTKIPLQGLFIIEDTQYISSDT